MKKMRQQQQPSPFIEHDVKEGSRERFLDYNIIGSLNNVYPFVDSFFL